METYKELYKSKLSIAGTNVIYLITMVLFITVGAFVQSRSFNSGIIITEFVLVALPAFIYVIIKRGSIKKEMRFNRLHFIDAVLVTVIFFSGYPIAMFVNLIGNIIVSLFGKLITSPVPLATNLKEYFIMLMIVAGTAGLCEEILFRGLILRGYEKLGMWKSIVFTAVLFAMLHMNIQNIFGPLLLGILLGYVVHVTNSIYAGMLGHFVNNGISVSMTFLLMQLPALKNAPVQELPQGAETLGLFVWAVISGFFAVLAGILLIFAMRALKKVNSERAEHIDTDNGEFENQKLRNILKSPKLSWPLYASFVFFIAYLGLQLTYIITGKPLLDLIL